VIRHAALFRLRHDAGSPEEAGFLTAAAGLAVIPGVNDFQIGRETSPKNPYAFVVAMTFSDQSAYDGYNDHPLHVAFVQDRWLPEVAEFMEHDSVSL
jgi:Stress responsive A/B Barrel Domain